MVRRTFVLGAALAVAVASAASAASSGLYSGQTSRSMKITVQVKSGEVVKVHYGAGYGSCGIFTGTDKVKLAIKNNKFRGTVHPNSEVTDTLTGTFKGKSVTGTLSSVLKTGGIHPQTCKTGKLRFSAKL